MLYKKTIVGALAALTLVGGAAAQAQMSQPGHAGAGKAPAVAKVVQPVADHRDDEGHHKPCHYPGQVYTHTSLSIQKSVQERGTHNYAFVHVDANSGVPRGSVRVYIVPTSGEGRSYVRYGELHGGNARVELPEWAAIGTYDVYAQYFPNKCGKWKGSTSEHESYTVVKRHRHHHG